MRKSSYMTDVKVDGSNDHMLIHGYTGAIDLVNDKIVSFINSHDTFTESEFPYSAKTWSALIQRGYITEKAEQEEYDYVAYMADILFRRDMLLKKGFTFVITYDCNFRCPYCFEKGVGRDKMVFTPEMVDKAFEAIFYIEPNEKYFFKNITLYGGEPLLVQNRKIISYIIDRGKRLGFTFSAITNGYDLVAYEDLLSPDGIAFLQITVDGVRDHHNSRRIHCQGFPTFDRILDNIGLALKRGVRVSVRVNTDRENIEDLKELQAIFERLQYVENPLFSMNSALLVDYSESETDNTYHYLTQREFIQKHSVSKSQFEYQDYGVFDKLYQAIMRKKPLSFHPIFCRAQTGSFVFDPYGNIYPCWEVVGRPEHCIGHYASAGGVSWSQEPLDNWHKAHISEIQACTVCKYALLCGCGCPAHNLKRHHCLRMEDIVRYAVNKAYADLQLNN
ncbi:MAG TPA: radical SAM protein [Candidatus Caccoplasma intestinavium]|uniref:Radical SAM protein n=2 Tax=Bacteroidales TaxID=171549 RepID=A0A9D1KCS8_9BACT|nr:radical SAM protein [Candidatus Caccoplasma intestinavium]